MVFDSMILVWVVLTMVFQSWGLCKNRLKLSGSRHREVSASFFWWRVISNIFPLS
jgi:hypothetical protein